VIGSDDMSISTKDKTRISISARQVVAYTNFLRWMSNFKRDEIVRHPCHNQVILLSPMQSGRFSFAIEEGKLLIGVQDFEIPWIATMPFAAAYVSDRIYLSVRGRECMNTTIPLIVLGIFVDDHRKCVAMSATHSVQFIRVCIRNSRVVDVGEVIGECFPLKTADIIEQLAMEVKEKLKQQDTRRFF